MAKLPQGWVECPLNNFTDITMGQSPKSDTYNENGEGVPFFQGKAEFGIKYPKIKKWCTMPNKMADKGDILLSVRAPVGPTNICPQKACIGRGLASIKGLGNIDNIFIRYLLNNFEFKMHLVATGTTFKAISCENLKKILLPLPPLNEQRRIVEKIESEFAKIDEGLEHLEQAKEQIKQYRQSVLKSAFEGKLTQQNPDDESAEALLQKINPKAKFIHNDKLPQGWVECLIKDIAKNIQYGYTESANKDKIGPRFLRITDIQNNNVNWDLVPYCKIDDNIKSKYLLENGDFVFARTGATVGKSYLIENLKEESVYASYLISSILRY